MKLRKIGVFRALQIGDLLCAVPAIRALKSFWPETEITLIGLPWAESLVSRFGNYFSGFMHFPGFPGLIEQPFELKRFISFLTEVQGEHFDLILQMHGNGSVINPVISMMGARHVAGYFTPGQYCPEAGLFMPYPEDLPEIKRHLQLMEFLGIPALGDDLEFPVTEEEYKNCRALLQAAGVVRDNYVCIHPGARDPERRWKPQNFARMADAIAAKGYTVVFTGIQQEQEIIAGIMSKMQYPAVNYAGKADLGTMAAIIREARLLLSNDTGVSHIAAAVKTPSVIIFLTSDPGRWAPLNRNLHSVILPQESDNTDFVLSSIERGLLVKSRGKEYKADVRIM